MSTLLTTKEPASPQARRHVLRVPFRVVSPTGRVLRNVPLTCGLCLPKGAAPENRAWIVEGLREKSVNAQTEVLDRWNDGSVRWLLVHFVAPELTDHETPCVLVPAETEGSFVRRLPARDASLVRDRDAFRLTLPDGECTFRVTLTDSNGQRLGLTVKDIGQESSGAERQVLTADLQVEGRQRIDLKIRFEVWPFAGLVHVQTRLRNGNRARHSGGLWDLGDAGSFLFRELSVEVTSPELTSPRSIAWRVASGGITRTADPGDDIRIVQYGSGGRNWSSTNHVDADGAVAVRERGFEARFPNGVLRGYRSEPTVAIDGGRHEVSVAVPECWQQFPSELSVRGGSGAIGVGLFPAIDGLIHELQGGEQKTQSFWLSLRASAKGEQELNWVHQPPRIVQPADWIASTGVFPWFPGTVPDKDRFAGYLRSATTGTRSIRARRDTIDEYGWRNFGDVPADHEQRHFRGSRTVVSHYNNQFDMILGGILNLAASGNADWFELFDPLARHVMDIDVYHTTQDRAAFNGGMFWHTDHYVDAATATHRGYSKANAAGKADYGGGLSNEHNYSTGLLYYYFLTGSLEARETVLSLADWVLRMDDGRSTIWGLFDSGDTGLASRTVTDDFHGPGRGAGNSINALLDGWLLTRDPKYMQKAEQLIQRTVHPKQDCDALHLLDSEGHWSYTVCLNVIGRYLTIKRDAEQFDAAYAYSRDVLAHYGRWMAANERASLSDPEGLEFYTEAWAAQDFRKVNVMRIAASCCDDPVDEQAMRQRADRISDDAWKYLFEFGDQHLTSRCLSIVMTEGLREVFHRTCEPDYLRPSTAKYPDSTWAMFVPQKTRVRRLLKSPAGLLLAAVRTLNPVRCLRTFDAFRRHIS
ncbi:MAG: hypothetical protein R3C19_10760 [Planctomycetaceae bacterium]